MKGKTKVNLDNHIGDRPSPFPSASTAPFSSEPTSVAINPAESEDVLIRCESFDHYEQLVINESLHDVIRTGLRMKLLALQAREAGDIKSAQRRMALRSDHIDFLVGILEEQLGMVSDVEANDVEGPGAEGTSDEEKSGNENRVDDVEIKDGEDVGGEMADGVEEA